MGAVVFEDTPRRYVVYTASKREKCAECNLNTFGVNLKRYQWSAE